MNFYHNCFIYDHYFRGGRYLFDNNDDRAKTLDDSKPKHHHIYMCTENKVKKHKAAISNICLLQVVSIVMLIAKILICCR